MVAAVRRGDSYRQVAHRFRCGLRTVFRWVRRARHQRLDRVDWSDRPRGNPTPPNRIPSRLVGRILRLRQWLKRHSPLGEYGAAAIRAQLQAEHAQPLPAIRTIGRVLVRHDQVHRRRVRRPPPPPGWYLPALADGSAELDAFDVVEGLVIRRGPEVQVLNGISLYGSLAVSWPRPAILTAQVLRCLPEHWQRFGLPHYAQFDNDTRFQGTHRHPDCLGRVVHLCLGLGVVPVFAPPRETGFQAKIESDNDLWQDKVWQRWRHPSLPALARRSDRFVAAHRYKHAPRFESAPPRLPWPPSIPQHPVQPRVIFLRRTDEQGRRRLRQQTRRVDRHWPHSPTRARRTQRPHRPTAMLRSAPPPTRLATVAPHPPTPGPTGPLASAGTRTLAHCRVAISLMTQCFPWPVTCPLNREMRVPTQPVQRFNDSTF